MKRNQVVAIAIVVAAWTLGAPARAETVRLSVDLSQTTLLSGQRQLAYLRVGLAGLVIPTERRAPINVSIVIDRSGSMSGDKLRRAKQAAIEAVERLAADDIVSVVAYDHNIQVLMPATKVSDRREIIRAISRLSPGGSTALFAGVSKGAAEVRKFLSEQRVNRVVLLSDGLANVGPSSTEALAALGASLGKEGVSVTTIGLGLGYNEDLMFALARNSDGNHAFVESAADLARIFAYEFGDLLSVVAKDVEVFVECGEGVRPVRVLGRDAEIVGQRVVTRLSQLYGKQEKYVLLEVELPAGEDGQRLPLAQVSASYVNALSGSRSQLANAAAVTFSRSAAEVERSVNRLVMVSAVEQIANYTNKRALELRDEGKLDEARSLLLANERYLNDNAARYREQRLRKVGDSNRTDADNLDEANWNRQRKQMRKNQYNFDSQQAW